MNTITNLIVNAVAERKYRDFVSALTAVWFCLEELNGPITRLAQTPRVSRRVLAGEELQALLHRAEQDLEMLESRAKRYKAELISREWKV